ncbi:UNVERIFIED_CONTAM: hypothetical protein FKN15_061156 [Acipenser sinensis]
MALEESNQDPELFLVATYRHQAQKLPRFHGTASLEAFLAKFELFAVDFGWTHRRKAICLAQSLEGPASELLLDHTSEERLNSTTLMGALKWGLGDCQSYLALQDQLQLRWRAPGEKLGTLAADIAVDFAWTHRRKAICLAQSLEGPASELLLDHTSEERLNSTTLMGALKWGLGDSQSYLALQDQLQLRWRAPGEKLGTLAADISCLARQA